MAAPTADGGVRVDDQVRMAFHADIETLKARLVQDPTNAVILLELARKYHDGHKVADAVPYYRDYLALEPSDEQTWLDLVNALAELEQWEDAESVTRQLLNINPHNVSALYNLGAIRANLGDYTEARRLWEQVRDDRSNTNVASQAQAALTRLATIAS